MDQRSDRNVETAVDLSTSLDWSNGNVFHGYVVDPENLDRRFTVELLIDGEVLKTTYANDYVATLAKDGIGDGCFGFAFAIDSRVLENAAMAEVRVANLDVPVGTAIRLRDAWTTPKVTPATSRLRWLGGLRFSGWVEEPSETAPRLEVSVNGEPVMEVRASGWAQADDPVNQTRPVRAFDIHLPERFADGRVRRVSVVNDVGLPLPDGPLPFVAFPDGLAATIDNIGTLRSERLRGELYDRLIPTSLPMSAYAEWQRRFPVPDGDAISCKGAVIFVGQGALEVSLDSLEDQAEASWVACAMEPDDDPTALQARTARSFLSKEASDCSFVLFALAGTSFRPQALQRIAQAFAEFDDAVAVYGDIDIVANDGGVWPLALPAFDYERLLEQGYCAHLFAVRRDVAERVIAVSPPNLYRAFNVLLDDSGDSSSRIVHLPGALAILPPFDRAAASHGLRRATSAHLRRRGSKATVTESECGVFPAVRVQRQRPDGHVTILIPTRNRADLLKDCLQSIRPAVETVGGDVVVVDNDSTDRETLDLLATIGDEGIRVLRIPGPFNFARLNNLAARTVETEFLCLLNNDIKALDSDWLAEMLGRIAEPDVGAVGAMLLWPSGVIQHGGVVLGPHFMAAHAFNDRVAGDPGYLDQMIVAHECSAVTAACMLTRTADYVEIGGMDDVNFPVSFNDVDFCLRLRQGGKRIVFTPRASLIHIESASRGSDARSERMARYARELGGLRARWGQVLIDDPYYNPILSLNGAPFSALAWPPRDMSPRPNHPPRPADLPRGL